MTSIRIDRNRFKKVYSLGRRKSIIAYISDTDPELSGSMALQSLGIISVKDELYGAQGNGTTLDTTAITNALSAVSDGECLFFPPGTYLCGNINVASRNNIEIFGWNATIQWTGSNGSDPVGFQLSGLCDNLKIHNLKLIGDSSEANLHAGVWSVDSQISNITLEELHINNVVNGIYFNAASNGYIRDSSFRNNRISYAV
jgi:polygalacturonase